MSNTTYGNNNGNLSYKDIISEYLNKRADEDEFFREKYLNSGKTVDNALAYITKIAGERRSGSPVVVMRDDEVFDLAVHFYLEDSIPAQTPVQAPARIQPASKPTPKPATPDSDGYIQLELF